MIVKGVEVKEVKEVYGTCRREVDAWWDVSG